jgi:glycosyltransferase involved in cell wall biosynthesis
MGADSMDECISVILPVFNRANTVGTAVRSVLRQTHRNLLLYVVDDGSTDGSRDVIRQFVDHRLVLLERDRNEGVCRARNAGLSAASTNLVAFIDSDDAWLPEKLAEQLAFLRHQQKDEPRLGIVGCGWRLVGSRVPAKSFEVGPFDWEDVMQRRVAGIGTPMLLVDRAATVPGALFDPRFPALEETDYVLSAMADGALLEVLPTQLAVVKRGLGDHVANSRNAAASYEEFFEKYRPELTDRPDLSSRLCFKACREHVLNRDVAGCIRRLRCALSEAPIRRVFHLLLGWLAGRRGFAVAQRLGPLGDGRVQITH